MPGRAKGLGTGRVCARTFSASLPDHSEDPFQCCSRIFKGKKNNYLLQPTSLPRIPTFKKLLLFFFSHCTSWENVHLLGRFCTVEKRLETHKGWALQSLFLIMSFFSMHFPGNPVHSLVPPTLSFHCLTDTGLQTAMTVTEIMSFADCVFCDCVCAEFLPDT